MSVNDLRHELQNILSGKSTVSHGTLIQTITHYLGRSTGTSPMAQDSQHNKREETERLITFIEKENPLCQKLVGGDAAGLLSALSSFLPSSDGTSCPTNQEMYGARSAKRTVLRPSAQLFAQRGDFKTPETMIIITQNLESF